MSRAYSTSSAVRFPRKAGSDPWIWLFCSARCCSDARFPKDSGIMPLKKLLLNVLWTNTQCTTCGDSQSELDFKKQQQAHKVVSCVISPTELAMDPRKELSCNCLQKTDGWESGAHHQHSIKHGTNTQSIVSDLGAYSSNSSVNVENCDGIVPVNEFWSSHLQKKLHLKGWERGLWASCCRDA